MAGRQVRFEWVKGHAGHDMNEAADLRARADALEEDAAWFVFGTAEFAPYGAAGGPEATTGGLL